MGNMRFKVGDRVRIKSLDWYNENKDEDGNVVCLYSYFDNGMSEFCDKIVTIKLLHGCPNVKAFRIIEDNGYSWWSDDMIEGLVEEEVDLIPKFGEYSDNEPLDVPTITTDFVKEHGLPCPEGYQFVDENGNVINAQKIVLEKLVVPKFKKGDKIKDKNNRVWYVVSVGNRHFDISSVPYAQGYFVPMEDQDDYELFPGRELQKTYEECEKILGLEDSIIEGCLGYEYKLLNIFQKLLMCRDAYWKIAGEEMGLGKPWKPDWKNEDTKFIIQTYDNEVEYWSVIATNRTLAFPTEEMRDAFYENFKSEIESCKELL